MARTRRRIALNKLVQFENLSPELIKAVEKRNADVLRAFAPELAATAREEVPVDEGDLQGTIQSGVDHSGRLYLASGGIGARHAHLVEFGTVNVAPNPFMRRTVRKSTAALRTDLKRRLGEPYIL